MKIYIPSLGRADKVVTLNSIPEKWLDRTKVVVTQKEYNSYAKHIPLENLLVIPTRIKGISKTREHIMNVCNERTLLMLDDDMVFCKRLSMAHPKLKSIDNDRDMNNLFAIVEKLLKNYPAVGISARQGNNRVNEEVRECTRMMNAYAFDIPKMRELGINFGRTPVMEDFDVTLQLLRKGFKNAVIYKYCWNQRGSGAEGGCATYRTAELQKKGALKLKKLHPDFVKIVEKESKSGWDGMKIRTDVIVYWRKAYESSIDNSK